MAVKEHSKTAQSMVWTERPFDNGVGGKEYASNAVGIFFSIHEQNPNGPASMRQRYASALASDFVGTFSSVKQAQFRARRIVDEWVQK